MSDSNDDLIGRLEQGPCFLFLGQRYLLIEGGEDPLAGPVRRALGRTSGGGEGLYELLATASNDARAVLLQTLAAEARALAAPAWLRQVADLAWNGVFSSAVDSLFIEALQQGPRTVQPVANSSERPPSPRSVSQTQAVLLFGGCDQQPEDQPPTGVLGLAQRRAEAHALAKRLPDELITPRGVLVIEGWGVDDWLTPESLYSTILSRLGRGQAHLFSAGAAALGDPYLAAAIADGILVVHTEDLASYVDQAQEVGRLRSRRIETGGHLIRYQRELFEIPKDIWSAVTAFGRPLDVELLATQPEQSEELRYARFRQFLGGSESYPIWSALASRLQFRRDFEGKLRQEVEEALTNRGLLDHRPVLLTGQTGTGKTVAMASLAFDMARRGAQVVLYIPRRLVRPSYEVVDSFCEWVEREVGTDTLIVWDGMLETDEYFRLEKYLDSRGRRAVLVGSCYVSKELADDEDNAKAKAKGGKGKGGAKAKPTPRPKPPKGLVIAEKLLGGKDGKELDRFADYLKSFGVEISPADKAKIESDEAFLSALYRLLPETRGPVSEGLHLELTYAEQKLASEAKLGAEHAPVTAMAYALQSAGLLDNLETALEEFHEESGEEGPYRSPYERLVKIVLVGAQHGHPIPLELALRVVGRQGVRNLPQLLGKIDLIRWLEDDDGNYALDARNELEARILVQETRTSREAEIEALADVLSQIRPDTTGGGGSEVEFAVRLFSRIGPQGPNGSSYSMYFRRLADAVGDANSAAEFPNPRLAALETNLLREWVKIAQLAPDVDQSERLEVLEQAEAVVEQALRQTVPSPGRQRFGVRANLLVEQASLVGTRIWELLRSGPDSTLPVPAPVDAVTSMVKRVERITAEATKENSEKFHPVDVLCWVVIDVVDKKILSSTEAVRLLAEATARLLLVDTDELSEHQQTVYTERFARLAGLAGDKDLAADKLAELAARDDALAAYFTALRMSGELDRRRKLENARPAADPAACQAASDHLRSRPAALSDQRCLRLLVDLFWLAKTGFRFMERERLTLPLDRRDWDECLELATSLRHVDDLSGFRVTFMQALALFHLGRVDEAFKLFADVERQSYNVKKRIVNTYVASRTNGQPQPFHPVVRRVDHDLRKGFCWVGDLVREVPFQPYDFGDEAPPRNKALRESYITFNLRGPILEPARRPPDRRAPEIIGKPVVSPEPEEDW